MTTDLQGLRELAATWLRAMSEWEEQPRALTPGQLRYLADLLDGARSEPRGISRGPLALEVPAKQAPRVLEFPVHRARNGGAA